MAPIDADVLCCCSCGVTHQRTPPRRPRKLRPVLHRSGGRERRTVVLIELVARARVMQAVLAEPTREVLAVSRSDDRLAVAFRTSGRHVGTLPTPIGDIRPTGQTHTLRVIDILILRDGRIAEVHMIADFAGALVSVNDGQTDSLDPMAPDNFVAGD
jgi:hypothetical protein